MITGGKHMCRATETELSARQGRSGFVSFFQLTSKAPISPHVSNFDGYKIGYSGCQTNKLLDALYFVLHVLGAKYLYNAVNYFLLLLICIYRHLK